MRRVVNASGVVLHTGLGRAPLSQEARSNLQEVAQGYCNLELDLDSGKRGDRTAHVERLLCYLTGAEAACVVNNNAAAVLLALNTLAFDRQALISRGQLVEIGGSFRMPQVMEKSGVIMVEVGTTNKTHLDDYRDAFSSQTGVICVVHTSNYRVKGFTDEVALSDLVALARSKGVPVIQDLGGGILFDLRDLDLPQEPVVRESIESGVDVVTFSGDKVLGGPQSGIIVGRKKFIDLLKANPLMRALRCDKLTYAVLEPTLKSYLDRSALLQDNAVFAALLKPLTELKQCGERLLKMLRGLSGSAFEFAVVDSQVQAGSGALPLAEIPSKAIAVNSKALSCEALSRTLRQHEPAIIGYIRDNRLLLDLRTLQKDDELSVIAAFEQVAVSL